MEEINFNDRKIQFWYYHVSHGEVLIRSLKDHVYDMLINFLYGHMSIL